MINYDNDRIPRMVTDIYDPNIRQTIYCDKIAYVHNPNEVFHIDYEITLHLIQGNKEKENA